ncbi:hypothetical protein FRC17_010014 [Serendipita sp. 399]|nr:hypothetical protein FRC17_010014 [Serendipita sp. 399]
MSLDQNLFTLAIAGSAEESGALDLTDPNSGTIHYRKRLNAGDAENPYSWGLYDPLSGGLLCTVYAPSASAKQKWIELYNPDAKIELSFTGSLHTFEWRRESCYLIRKPDPPVQVAVTREPAGRIRTSQVQLLDYNLNRFDIDDRKGLEIVMLAALLSFQDHSEALRNNTGASAASAPPSRHNSDGPMAPSPSDVISATQTKHKMHQNDVVIGDEASVEDFANHCVQLLKDPSMLYIVLRSHSPEHVPKVIQVAEATKRFHYKSGGHNEELHQYVTMEDKKPEQEGPKVIKLDQASSKKKEKEYKLPQVVTVHLSKIPMPELQPKAPGNSKASHTPPKQSEALRPPNKAGRTPSPSRPEASSSSAHPHKLAKPHQPSPASTPYNYNMALYPPTGPPPSLASDKPHKHGKHQKHNGPGHSNYPLQSTPGAPPLQSTPGAPPLQSTPGAPVFPTPYMSTSKPTPSMANPGFTSSYPSGSPSQYPSGGSSAYPSSNSIPAPWSPNSGGIMNAQRPQSVSGPSGSYTSYNSTPGSSSSAHGSSQQYFPPPPAPPPPSQNQPGQPAQQGGIGATLTNGIASVGYSLLDRLTHKQTIQQPVGKP